MNKLKTIKKMTQNICIIMIIFLGILNIALSLPHSLKIFRTIGAYYNRFSYSELVIHRSLSIVIGFILIILSNRLYKRMRFAWIITIASLIISITITIFRSHGIMNPLIIIEFFITLVLIASFRDFSKKSDKISVKMALLVSVVSMSLVVLNTAITFFLMKGQFLDIYVFEDSLEKSIKLLFLMDTSVITAKSRLGHIYLDSAIFVNWACIISSLFLILKPLVYNPIIDKIDKDHARKIVDEYGQNPMSYLALEEDKIYFFGSRVDGVIAYAIVGDVAACCGDMICAEEDGKQLMKEFVAFCKKNDLSIVMINVTEKFIDQYKAAGFGNVKYGEDAYFKLEEYNLAGGQVAKVRAAINHANKAGIVVYEYKPNEERNKKIEAEIHNVSKEWMSMKKGGELSFMLGGIGLENPMGKRYFIAEDPNGYMLGFVVFTPFESGRGYLADVTRRRPKSPQGVMEKIIYDAFMIMKDEGVKWGSLGMVVFANIGEEEETGLLNKIFLFIYENLNSVYGFKELHHAKEKYNPTEWRPRYLAYYPKNFNLKIAYAIIKSQYPKGITDYLFSMIKQRNEKL